MYVEVTLSKWNGYYYCQSSTDIDSVIPDIRLGLSMSDYYNLSITNWIENKHLTMIS